MTDEDSLWRLFRDKVVPSQVAGDRVVLFAKGSWRYDLMSGVVRLDDAFAISPFEEILYEWKAIPSEVIIRLNASLNEAAPDLPFFPLLPAYILAPAVPFVAEGGFYDLITDTFEAPLIQKHLEEFYPEAGPAAPINDTSTTSIWVDFFEENWLCREKRPKKPNNSNPDDPNTAITRITERDPQLDQLRLIFAAVAACAVLALASVNVQQRGTIYQAEVRVREQATFEALREYEGEEGEFV